MLNTRPGLIDRRLSDLALGTPSVGEVSVDARGVGLRGPAGEAIGETKFGVDGEACMEM